MLSLAFTNVICLSKGIKINGKRPINIKVDLKIIDYIILVYFTIAVLWGILEIGLWGKNKFKNKN